MIRPVLGVELGVDASYTASSPLDSRATNRSLIPSFLWSMCQRVVDRFFETSTCKSTVSYSKLCESVRLFQLGLHRLFRSKRVLQFFCGFVINGVLCRVLILVSSYRDYCRCHIPKVHLRVFASRMLCLWRHVQCHRFSCSLGLCGRPGMSFQSRSAHIVFCCCLLESV